MKALHHRPQLGDAVWLLAPEGTVVDAITFGPLPPNASYSRDEDGTWHADWPPSPGGPNLLAPRPELGLNFGRGLS
jgi:hypothetical protein